MWASGTSRLEQGREEVVEAVRRRQHDAAEPLRTAGQHDLGEGSAGVVRDQQDVTQVEGVEEVRDQVGDPGRAEVGVRPERDLVRAERQVDAEAPEAGCRQIRDDVPPEIGVDQGAVDEHDRPPLAAFEVADVTVAEGHALFLPECW